MAVLPMSLLCILAILAVSVVGDSAVDASRHLTTCNIDPVSPLECPVGFTLFKFWHKKKCVEVCKSGFEYVHGKCYQVCKDGYVAEGEHCIKYKPREKYCPESIECGKYCPAGYKYWHWGKCYKEVCEGSGRKLKFFFGLPKCTKTYCKAADCPDGYHKECVFFSCKCVESCKLHFVYEHGNCLGPCPSGYHGKGDVCVKSYTRHSYAPAEVECGLFCPLEKPILKSHLCFKC